MSVNRSIKLIHAHTILTHMLFLLPVVVPYYASIGLTFQQFLIGEAVFAGMVLVSEVPSGWISDVWRRKTTLMAGALFAMAGLAGLMLADGFWMATISQGIIGIAVALNSGTNTALLYDTLADANRAGEYRRLDGNRHSAGMYGTALSCALGGLLFGVHPKLPLMCDVLVVFGAMIAIACIHEPHRHKKSVEKHLFHDMWATIKYAVSGHPEITGILLLSTVIFATTKLMLWAQQPFYMQIGVPVEWFGFIMTGGFIVGAIAAQQSHRFDRWGSNRAALGFTAFVLVMACLALAILPPLWIAVPMFLTGTLAYAVCTPRINDAVNARIGAERRATILSTLNLMANFLFIPTSAIVGHLSEVGNITDGLLWMGGQLLVLAAIGLWLWGRRGRQAASSSITGT